MNVTLGYTTRPKDHLGSKWGSSLKTRRLFDPRVCFFSPQPLWVLNKTIYCIYTVAFRVLLTVIYILLRNIFWSVGMKSAKICGTRLWFFTLNIVFRWRFEVVVSVSKLKWLLFRFFKQEYLFWCKTVTASQEKDIHHTVMFFFFFFSNTKAIHGEQCGKAANHLENHLWLLIYFCSSYHTSIF